MYGCILDDDRSPCFLRTRNLIFKFSGLRKKYICVENLVGRDGGNWIIRGRISRSSVGIGSGTMQLGCLKPLDTFVSCKLECKTRGSNDHGANVEENMSVDSLSSKIVLFVGLYIEGCHKL